MRKDITFIKSFLKGLIDNKIEYCILRKADMILKGLAHDIDMVIDFSQINDVYKILSELSKTLEWELFLKTVKDNGNIVTVHFFTIHEKQVYIVHFDLFKNFSWNSIPMLSNSELLKSIIVKDGIYSCSKSVEAITKLFSRYLYHGYVKDEYKEDIVTLFLNNKFEVICKMSLFLDKEIAESIYNLVITQDWNKLIALRPKVQSNIKSRYYTSLQHKVMHKLGISVFKFRRYYKQKGVMIAFIGTDGSGKSTIIENLPLILERTFDKSQIKYYHWRPKIIKSPKGDKRSIKNVSEPHKKKPYSKIISLGKFMYFNLDYILGYWLSVKVHLGKNKLVVFDRYYYDYMIDKYRYRLNLSECTIKAFLWFIPKPDITFLLVGDPKVLYERKKELPIELVKEQVNSLLKKRSKFPNSKVIDVNKNIDDVMFDVSRSILEFMKKREN